ncbi:uncharacterized protein LOC109717862 [Ananas comosus]|uniref:Uncharacterized protein LOC109717862 n=1 Tax=Ananas comosus TaxID=4615 RepID=A0A199V6B8_ANACO|nr:uncharacterized protein LOC109717862 [Ananas comosus]OAY72627.1 hypothetical protein ACMD2_22709 [Ananas comosus]
MAKFLPLLLVVSFFSLSLPSLSENPNPNPNPKSISAYDELRLSGFPIGLLPSNVRGYSLNRTSGDFSVELLHRCRITLPPDNYLAAYSPRITGNLSGGRISGLDGIRVRAFFRWWSITAIRASGDDLVFEVGVASAKYPSKNFDESPECEGGNPSKAAS